MTRQEELVQAARKEYPEWEEAQCHFIDGAHYADAHPKRITIPYEAIEDAAKEIIVKDWQARQDRLWAMIERNLRAKFIAKACEWLKNYAYIYVSETTGDLYEDDLINDFRKDMRGD